MIKLFSLEGNKLYDLTLKEGKQRRVLEFITDLWFLDEPSVPV